MNFVFQPEILSDDSKQYYKPDQTFDASFQHSSVFDIWCLGHVLFDKTKKQKTTEKWYQKCKWPIQSAKKNYKGCKHYNVCS